MLKLGANEVLIAALCVGGSNLIWLPVSGALSDRIGRKPILVATAVGAILTAYPVMSWLTASPSFAHLLMAELWLSFLYAGYNGAMVVYLTEIVPASVRASGFSLAYSLATCIRRLHAGAVHLADPRDWRQGGAGALDVGRGFERAHRGVGVEACGVRAQFGASSALIRVRSTTRRPSSSRVIASANFTPYRTSAGR